MSLDDVIEDWGEFSPIAHWKKKQPTKPNQTKKQQQQIFKYQNVSPKQGK